MLLFGSRIAQALKEQEFDAGFFLDLKISSGMNSKMFQGPGRTEWDLAVATLSPHGVLGGNKIDVTLIKHSGYGFSEWEDIHQFRYSILRVGEEA